MPRIATFCWLAAAVLAGSPARAADPAVEQGRRLIEQAGCANCHSIPGVRAAAAQGRVGPPLEAFGRRVYVAGILPNTPGALARWIYDPPSVHPRTAMPRVDITPAQALQMAAYLRSLK